MDKQCQTYRKQTLTLQNECSNGLELERRTSEVVLLHKTLQLVLFFLVYLLFFQVWRNAVNRVPDLPYEKQAAAHWSCVT